MRFLSHRRALARSASISVAIVLLVCSCGPTPDPEQASRAAADARAADERAVRAVDSALTAAIVAKDVERTAGFYAEDAVLMPVAEPVVSGHAAIRAKWTEYFGIPGFASRARLDTVEASGGTLAYTRGTYESSMAAPDGKPVTERGKWMTVWRRQADGTWRIAVDISNTDTPPPDHAESQHQHDATANARKR